MRPWLVVALGTSVCFRIFKNIATIELYENSRFRQESFICALILVRFSLPIVKFSYRPFTKGTCATPFTVEEKDALSLGSPSPEPHGEFDTGSPAPEVIPASFHRLHLPVTIAMKPNVPYSGDVVVPQDGATATFHVAPLANPHLPLPDESAKGCPTHHAHRQWLPPAESTEFCRVNEESGTLVFPFAIPGQRSFATLAQRQCYRPRRPARSHGCTSSWKLTRPRRKLCVPAA